MGGAADVVEMAVGDDDATDFFASFFEVCDIRNDIIDAVHVFFGELESEVDDENVFFGFENGEVFTNFLEAAEGINAEELIF